MRLVSPLLRRVAYPMLSWTGYLRAHARKGRLCIVTYHGVKPAGYVSSDSKLDGGLITVEALRRQLRVLKSRYTVVSPEHLLDWLHSGRELPTAAVLLTCDDGLRNTLTDMLPVLKEEKLSCLFFVTGASTEATPRMLWYEELYLLLQRGPVGPIDIPDTDLRGTESYTHRRQLWWDLVKRLSQRDPPDRSQFMGTMRKRFGLRDGWMNQHLQRPAHGNRFLQLTLSEVQQLAAEGMTIGAHTLTHPYLSQCSRENAEQEITEIRARLESALGRKIWAFAYPFGNPGSIGPREVQLAKAAGYAAAFVNVGGGFGAELPQFALPRVHVTADMGLGEFEAHVSGFYRALRRPEAVPSGPNFLV